MTFERAILGVSVKKSHSLLYEFALYSVGSVEVVEIIEIVQIFDLDCPFGLAPKSFE